MIFQDLTPSSVLKGVCSIRIMTIKQAHEVTYPPMEVGKKMPLRVPGGTFFVV